jgi:hypothetical protein
MNSVEPEQRQRSTSSYRITVRMQGPTEDDEASVPSEHVINGPNLNRTFTVRRKAAKRILPWDLPADEIQLVPPRPQDEDIIQEKKRPRLEEPFSTSPTDEATTENPFHAVSNHRNSQSQGVLYPSNMLVANTKAKQRRTNWGERENFAKLHAAFLKWQRPGGVLDDNGKALSRRGFAKTEGIPNSVFFRYAIKQQKTGTLAGET